MERPFAESVVFGVVQGITEILPVSSSGHLALAEILFGVRQSARMSMLIELGTFVATAVVLRRRILAAVVEGWLSLAHPSRLSRTPGGRDALTMLVATIPTLAIGWSLRGFTEVWTSSPLVVGLGFVITAIVLFSTRWVKVGKEDAPSVLGALLIGVAQGLAVLPGISRSGATIALVLWLGIRPSRAFEVSMLIALPAMILAAFVRTSELAGGLGALPPALLGGAMAFGAALFALHLLRRALLQGYFSLFVLWVIPLAVATLALARAWPGG